jgi:hypothetical protein
MADMFIAHNPIAPPRNGTPGEGIFLKLWQEFVEARPDDFTDIFRDIPSEIDQRIASVAASFMTFMGCNGGASFTYRAQRLGESGAFSYPNEAFLAAWALENRRTHFINHGLRMSEYMLATEYPIDRGPFRHSPNEERVPEISQRDNDVLECMVAWWSTEPARRMRDIAEPMIRAANKKQLSGLFATPTESAQREG